MKDPNNLLDHWHREWWCKTSKLYPYNQLISFRRKDIEGIYHTMKTYFGKEHFEPLVLNRCTYNDIDPIRCLLADSTGISNFRIFEIINAIRYTERKNPKLAHKLKNARNYPRHFMDLALESEVNRILDQAGFHIHHNVVKGSQPLDGYLVFDGKGYIVECKKAYNFKFDLIHGLWTMLLNMLSKIEKMNKGIGLYGYFTINENSVKKSTHDLNDIVNKFFKQLLKKDNYYLKSEHGGLKWRTFPYHKKDFLLKLNEQDWTFLFRIEPPDTISPGVINRYHSEIRFQYGINREDARKKLDSIIKKAKRQHKANTDLPLLLFLDFETNRSLFNPLFSSPKDIYINRIKEQVNKSAKDVIVCMLFRNYTSISPQKTMEVVCDEKFNELRQKLLSMSLNDSFKLEMVR